MSELMIRSPYLHPAGKPVAVKRVPKSMAEEALIEEILRAAGLEPTG